MKQTHVIFSVIPVDDDILGSRGRFELTLGVFPTFHDAGTFFQHIDDIIQNLRSAGSTTVDSESLFDRHGFILLPNAFLPFSPLHLLPCASYDFRLFLESREQPSIVA